MNKGFIRRYLPPLIYVEENPGSFSPASSAISKGKLQSEHLHLKDAPLESAASKSTSGNTTVANDKREKCKRESIRVRDKSSDDSDEVTSQDEKFNSYFQNY